MVIVFIALKFVLKATGIAHLVSLSWGDYLKDFVCFGSTHLFTTTIELSHDIRDNVLSLNFLKLWFSFTIKYFIPWFLWQIIILFDV